MMAVTSAAGGSRYGLPHRCVRVPGTVFAWGQNQASVAGGASDFNFWSGVRRYGGVPRASCNTVAPTSSCIKSWASDSPFVSVSQAFPPFGEVAIAVRLH